MIKLYYYSKSNYLHKMAQLTIPTQASELKNGNYICINNRPCKIVDQSASKTGKHGGRKIHFHATDIFTNKKFEYCEMSEQNVEVPIVTKNEYQLTSIENNIVSYFDDDANIQSDLFLPHSCEEDEILSEQIKKHFKDNSEIYINVISAMGTTEIKGFRLQNL